MRAAVDGLKLSLLERLLRKLLPPLDGGFQRKPRFGRPARKWIVKLKQLCIPLRRDYVASLQHIEQAGGLKQD
jgi:hypothetical protein